MNNKNGKSPVLRALLIPGIPLAAGLLYWFMGYYSSGSSITNIIRFIAGVIGLLGIAIILLVRYLAGSWPGVPASEDEDEIDSLMRFNKINAPMQNRRENLVIILWLVIMVSLLVFLYRDTFS